MEKIKNENDSKSFDWDKWRTKFAGTEKYVLFVGTWIKIFSPERFQIRLDP